MGSKFKYLSLRCWYAIMIYWIDITHDLSSSITIMLIFLFSTISIPSLAAARATAAIGDPNSFSAYIYNFSSSTLTRTNHKTGVLYNVSATDLPSPLNTMQVSVIRLRRSNLWARGLHGLFESVDIPPRITTRPYVKRVDIIFSNLGKNLSSQYYDFPGYTIITSVTSFLAYASSNANNCESTASAAASTPPPPPLLNLSVRGEPIKVKFSNLLIDHDHPTSPLGKKKCLRFDPSGLVELSDMAVGDDQDNVCSSHGQGHFAIAIPSSPPLPVKRRKKKRRKNIRLWKWWLIGFMGGLIGLMFAGLIGFFLYKAYKVREFKRMEKKSERSESLGNTWINGTSRMPSASFTRTEAASSMEDEYFS